MRCLFTSDFAFISYSMMRFSALNNSNFSLEYSFNRKFRQRDSELEYTSKRIAFVLCSVLGSIGNIFAIVIAIKCAVRKTLHHLIINMALSDLLFLLLSPLKRLQWLADNRNIYPGGTSGVAIYKTIIFFRLVSYRISFITLLAISIQRFISTRNTMQIIRPCTLKQRVVIILICWLIPMPVSGCISYVKKSCGVSVSSDSWNKTCSLLWSIFDILTVILCFAILILSILTIKRLSQPQEIEAHLNEQQRIRRARRTRAAVRMVLFSVLLYACCWLPNFVYNSLVSFELVMESSVDIVDLSGINSGAFLFITWNFLPVINACFSPVIYIIFLPDFRETAKRFLCKLVASCRKHPIEPAANPQTNSTRS